ncbi:MAG: VRR-NUC domain-containing protein [Bacteroidales bacterium]|nr:VRR-NUC domain-containing protein [Bacteroidales bacterium]
MSRSKRPEESFTSAVLGLARLHGWMSAHFRPARTRSGWRTAVQGDGKGFPDLVLVHLDRGSLVVAELKVGENKPSPEQGRWLAAFRAAGVPAYLWTPADWDAIECVLQNPQGRS